MTHLLLIFERKITFVFGQFQGEVLLKYGFIFYSLCYYNPAVIQLYELKSQESTTLRRVQ